MLLKIDKFKFRIETLISMLLSFIVIATIVGTLNVFLKIKWGYFTLAIIIICSILLGYSVKKFFYINEKKNRRIMILVMIILTIIYGIYSPVLEVRQDPSVYMLKSMNLINYGTTYDPNNSLDILINDRVLDKQNYKGYATILNGTEYLGYGIETDFYAGPSFINASLGLLNKDFSFYGVTLIGVLIGVLVYYILIQNEFFKKNYKIAGALTLVFMISPINTWFFRGTYSESISCLYFLLLGYFFTKVQKMNLNSNLFIILTSIAAYCNRLDYIIIILMVIFILAYSNIKYGLINAIIALVSHCIVKNTYEIYYSRISTNDFKVIQLAYLLIILAFIMGSIFNILKTKDIISIEKIIENKIFKYLLIILAFVIIILSFRSSFVRNGNFEQVFMDGAIRQSYNEEIFNRFFMVFPSFIIIFGIINLPKFLLHEEFNEKSKIFLMGIFIPYCYYLYKSGNSPQLYFNMRRYVYILLPIIFFSFAYFISKMDKKVANLIVLGAAILMLHTQLDSKQIIEFKGLDKSVQSFEDKYCTDEAVFLYNSDLRYDFSSIISYMKNDAIPVDDLSMLKLINQSLNGKTIYYVSRNSMNSQSEKFDVSYTRMGENFDDLPKDRQNKKLEMYITPLTGLINNSTESDEIYPNTSLTFTGFYENGPWTDGNLNIYGTILNNKSNNYIVLRRCDYSNPLADKNELGIVVYVNDIKISLEKTSEDGLSLYYKLPNDIKEISKITIKSNTFIPKDEGINGDGRKLGIDIESIKMSK